MHHVCAGSQKLDISSKHALETTAGIQVRLCSVYSAFLEAFYHQTKKEEHLHMLCVLRKGWCQCEICLAFPPMASSARPKYWNYHSSELMVSGMMRDMLYVRLLRKRLGRETCFQCWSRVVFIKKAIYQAMRGVSLDTKNTSTRIDVQSLGLKSNATNDTF